MELVVVVVIVVYIERTLMRVNVLNLYYQQNPTAYMLYLQR